MFQQVLTIARNAFVESIRQPVFVALVIVGTMFLIVSVPMTEYTLEDDTKMLVDMGFSTLFLVGLALAATTATSVLYRELENKTVLTVMSKPIARPLFVLGKYLGVSSAIVLAYWVLAAIFLLTARHGVLQKASDQVDWPPVVFGALAAVVAVVVAAAANYFYHRVFTSTIIGALAVTITAAWGLVLFISDEWAFQSPAESFDSQLMIGLLLVLQLLLIVSAVAVAVSTRLGQVMTLMICVGVFLIGLLSDYFLGQWAGKHPDSLLAQALYGVVPNFQLVWPADALTQGHDFDSVYVGLASSHSVLYIAALLALAMALFQTREVG